MTAIYIDFDMVVAEPLNTSQVNDLRPDMPGATPGTMPDTLHNPQLYARIGTVSAARDCGILAGRSYHAGSGMLRSTAGNDARTRRPSASSATTPAPRGDRLSRSAYPFGARPRRPHQVSERRCSNSRHASHGDKVRTYV